MVEVLERGAGDLRRPSHRARFLADPPALLVFAVCTGLLCLRRAGAFTCPQFWAEDGYFYERAYVLGWPSLALPYAGYYHAVPRLIGLTTVCFDPAYAPLLFAGCAGLSTLYVVSRVLSRRCPLPRTGGLFALAVVLVPDTYEVLLNVANLQWVLAVGLVLLLLSRDPVGWGGWLHDLAASAALGLTGPFSVVLAPFFVARAWQRRSGASAVLAGMVTVCACVQAQPLSGPSTGGTEFPGAHVAANLVLPAIGRRIGESLLLGAFTPAVTTVVGGTLVGLLTLVGVAGLSGSTGPLRNERCLLGLLFAGLLGVSLLRTRWTLTQYFTPHSDSRYMFLPQLLALWLLLLGAGWRGRRGRLAAAAALWALLANGPRLREDAYADMQWNNYVQRIRAGEAVVAPIDPDGWTLTLPER